MAMNFEELDDATRDRMRAAFDEEENSGQPYRSQVLSPAGLASFPDLMRTAIQGGDEVTLAAALNKPGLWLPKDAGEKAVNFAQASQRLALTEFNTWYVAGLARRLVQEGETSCQVYRAANPKWEHAACSSHEGQTFALEAIIDGHRAAYWPPPGVAGALSIPAGPGCHHTIRRQPV